MCLCYTAGMVIRITGYCHHAWRKPCIVPVMIVANGRRPLLGSLASKGGEAVVEKTPVGWVLVNQERRMRELCPEVRISAVNGTGHFLKKQ